MAVNTTKTKYIIFRTQGKIIDNNFQKLVFNSNEIGRPEDPLQIFEIERIHNAGTTKNFKLLGILFDEYLTFEPHINLLCSKISRSLYIMNRLRNMLPRKALLSLYYSLVHSHLNYCISIYGCANKTNLSKIFLKQKQAIRIVTNSNYRANTSPLFKTLKILPLHKQITFAQTKFMHNFKFNKTPFSFNQTWITNHMRNPNLNLRNNDDFYIQPHRLESLKRLPLFQFPKLWNECGPIKHENNPSAFLRSLKSKLFSEI